MSFMQKVFSSRSGANAATYVGQEGRIWYNSATNALYASDGATPGGIKVGSLGGGVSGYTTQIQYNDAGSFGSSSNFTYDKVTMTMTVGNIHTTAFSTSTANLGNLSFAGQTIMGTQLNGNINVSPSGTGTVRLLTGLEVFQGDFANPPYFTISNSGLVSTLVPNPNNLAGAFEIVGNPGADMVLPQQPGVMLHVTGIPSTSARIYNDGVANYAAVINRRYNGTSAAPTGVLANQIIGRLGATPYLINGTWPDISTTRLDFVSTEDQLTTQQGSQIQMWTVPKGSTTPVIIGQFDTSGIFLSGNLTPNSTSGQFSLGNSTNKWNELWVGPSSLHIEDSVTHLNASLTVSNSTLMINGTQRVQIGNMQMTTSGISLTNTTTQDITIGKAGDTGNTTILNAGVEFPDHTLQSTAGIPMTYMGAAFGVATLGADSKVTPTQLPAGAVYYKGAWNAATNTPTLADGVGTAGWEYDCAVAGTVNLGSGPLTFAVGDFVIYNGLIWQRIPGTGTGVTSWGVPGNIRTGAVTLVSSDIIDTLVNSSIINDKLQNSNVILNTGFGLSGGGTVNLGGSLTLTPSVGNILPGTGVDVTSLGGNYTVSIGQPVGTGNSVQFLAVSTSTTIQATGNITGGNISTGGKIVATGNIETLGYLKTPNTTINTGIVSNGNVTLSGASVNIGVISNLHIGGGLSGQFITTDGTGNIAWGNINGSAIQGSVATATTAGTVTTNAQPNITSVGTLTSLAVTGVSNLDSVANVKISGGTNGQYLTTDGTGNLAWSSTGIGTKFHGSFISNLTQINPSVSTVNAVTCNVTELSYGVSLVNGSRLTIANAGVYNIQFSLQVDKTDPGVDYIEIWLRKNGLNVDETNTIVEVADTRAVAAWNFLVSAAANDYYELYWYSADIAMRLLAVSASINPSRPAVPSVIITVVQV